MLAIKGVIRGMGVGEGGDGEEEGEQMSYVYTSGKLANEITVATNPFYSQGS